ncbi:MAG: hypothetical protein EKK37_17460 [Sphingobacteriales bacterium]|nr:MAG: hypothetical protein EKK37_17460 [Sphingobacteriales bacterium]
MVAVVKNINPYPSSVAILTGAPQELVTHRELRYEYHTNRSIKAWSVYFLLKSLTTSGKIQNWNRQIPRLTYWCQCNEKTLRSRLNELIRLKLIELTGIRGDIVLTSFKKAADILGIQYTGTYNINYNPTTHNGNQIFQYLLRGEEIRHNQQTQLEALRYKLDKNPSLKNNLHLMLKQQGADDRKLSNDIAYFQAQLLILQKRLFKEGSELLSYVMELRADINRSCCGIKQQHNYLSAQSVSYMKKRLRNLKLCNIQSVIIESATRSRLYVPDGLDKKRDGYKWLGKKKATAWRLCDQVTFLYESNLQPKQRETRKAA